MRDAQIFEGLIFNARPSPYISEMGERMSRIVLVLVVSLGVLFAPRIVDGCVIVPKPTVLDAYNDADVVVIARAISVEKLSDQEPMPLNGTRVVSTTMEVQKVFKGNLRIGDKMTFGQGNGIRCTWIFYEQEIGNEYLLYLETPPAGSPWYEFGYTRSDSIERVADDLLYLNNLEASRGRTRVSGTISRDEDEPSQPGEPGQKIRMRAKNKVYETTTDKNGVYEFYDLPPARYAIEPELPFGWKINRETRGTATISDPKRQINGRRVFFTLKPRQHAAIDMAFVMYNGVSGSVVDVHGKPLPEIQVSLKSLDAKNELNFEYTDEHGRFAIESVTPGNYIIVVNKDGKKTIQEPFGAFYYPNVTEEAKARVFSIRAGDNIKDLKIVASNVEEMVTVQGVVRYTDGAPARKVTVRFTPANVPGVDGSALVDTDAHGQFSFKIFKGLPGELHADFTPLSSNTAAIVGAYDYGKCPQVQTIIKQTGEQMLKTPVLRIDPQHDLRNLVLTFPFRSCK